MDYTIFYVLGVVVFTIVLIFATSYARKKKIFTSEDLLFAIKVLDLSSKIIDELQLQKEKQIRSITEIVISSLEFAVSNFANRDEIIVNAYEYAVEMCNKLEIELNEQRKEIIRELIIITLNNKYLKENLT